MNKQITHVTWNGNYGWLKVAAYSLPFFSSPWILMSPIMCMTDRIKQKWLCDFWSRTSIVCSFHFCILETLFPGTQHTYCEKPAHVERPHGGEPRHLGNTGVTKPQPTASVNLGHMNGPPWAPSTRGSSRCLQLQPAPHVTGDPHSWTQPQNSER